MEKYEIVIPQSCTQSVPARCNNLNLAYGCSQRGLRYRDRKTRQEINPQNRQRTQQEN